MAWSEKPALAQLVKYSDLQTPMTQAQLTLMASLQRLTGSKMPIRGKESASGAESSKNAGGGSAGASDDASKIGAGKGRTRIPRGDGKPRLCLMGQRRYVFVTHSINDLRPTKIFILALASRRSVMWSSISSLLPRHSISKPRLVSLVRRLSETTYHVCVYFYDLTMTIQLVYGIFCLGSSCSTRLLHRRV